MNDIIQFLNQTNFNWSIIESVAVIFSISYVILAAKENVWCWAAATVSVILYIYICFTAQLYAETGLQIFYLIMAIYGYYNWNTNNRKLQITEWSVRKHLFLILIGALLSFLMGFYFATYTDSKMPIIDSFTTVFSIIATYMIIKKVLENWLYWIVIDLVSVYLYYNRELQLTSILFMVYTIVAIIGYFTWLRKKKSDV